MQKKSQRIAGSRDVKFQAILNNGVVTIKGFVGNRLASEKYRFALANYPAHPFDRKQFMDRIYGTFEQDPNLIGQASRHTDAMIRATNQLLTENEIIS